MWCGVELEAAVGVKSEAAMGSGAVVESGAAAATVTMVAGESGAQGGWYPHQRGTIYSGSGITPPFPPPSPLSNPPFIIYFIILLFSEYEWVWVAAAVSQYLPPPVHINNSNSNYCRSFNYFNNQYTMGKTDTVGFVRYHMSFGSGMVLHGMGMVWENLTCGLPVFNSNYIHNTTWQNSFESHNHHHGCMWNGKCF